MGLTHFPNGISSFGIPIIGSGPTIPVTMGNYWFVCSNTGSNGNIGTKDKPFATIDYAIGKCSTKGDVIIVAPCHAETISTASAITCDVAGVTIVGLGTGTYSPKITFDTMATTTITITAASVTWDNIIFNANYADIATAFVVSGADATIKNCRFVEQTTNMNFLSCIITTSTNNAADGLKVLFNRRYSVDAAALAFISILGNINRLEVIGNFDNQASAANVGHFMICSSKVCLGTMVLGNVLNLTGDNNAQTVGVFQTGSSSTSTGVFAYNLVGSLDATTELFNTASQGFKLFENRMTGAADKQGYLVPAVDS